MRRSTVVTLALLAGFTAILLYTTLKAQAVECSACVTFNGVQNCAKASGKDSLEALRTDSDTLTEVFTYTMVDAAGATSTATLTITIHGRDDTPVARDDVNLAAAGTIRDPSQSVDAVGNVLPNDSDVDGGYTKTVTQIGVGAESTNPALVDVTSSNQ